MARRCGVGRAFRLLYLALQKTDGQGGVQPRRPGSLQGQDDSEIDAGPLRRRPRPLHQHDMGACLPCREEGEEVAAKAEEYTEGPTRSNG